MDNLSMSFLYGLVALLLYFIVNAIVWLYCRTMNSITPEEFVRFAHPYIMPEWCQEEYAACIEQNRPYKYVVEYYPIRFYTVQDKHGTGRKIWLYRNCAVGLMFRRGN